MRQHTVMSPDTWAEGQRRRDAQRRLKEYDRLARIRRLNDEIAAINRRNAEALRAMEYGPIEPQGLLAKVTGQPGSFDRPDEPRPR